MLQSYDPHQMYPPTPSIWTTSCLGGSSKIGLGFSLSQGKSPGKFFFSSWSLFVLPISQARSTMICSKLDFCPQLSSFCFLARATPERPPLLHRKVGCYHFHPSKKLTCYDTNLTGCIEWIKARFSTTRL